MTHSGRPGLLAPAKINLALHVTGQRADGYHLLDSLVVFADVGDRVTLSPGPLSLTVSGPFALQLGAQSGAGDDNLCLRAARLAGQEVAIHLEKNLPVASGIGGGTSDAAAVLRGLGVRPDRPEQLGADLPVCLAARPVRMRGVGEVLEPLPPLPPLHMVLINPGQGISTPQVFGALTCKDNPPLADPAGWAGFEDFIAYLTAARNDLEPVAIALRPLIAECLAGLRDAGAALARMSGSGATCFGLFADADAARQAAARLARPGWWVMPAGLAPASGLG